LKLRIQSLNPPIETRLNIRLSILNSGKQPKSFFEQLWKTISDGRVWQGEIISRRKDGSLYTEQANSHTGAE